MAPSFSPPLHVASYAAASSSAVKVASVSSKGKRKAQLALAVDGEGLWRYDVETLHPTWSFTVPPSTSFSTSPLTLSSPTSTDDFLTLASTSSPSELWAFRTKESGKETVSLPSEQEVVQLFNVASEEGTWALAVSVAGKGKAREYAVLDLASSTLALSALSMPKGYTPPKNLVHSSIHPSSAFPKLNLPATTSVLLEVFELGQVRAWSVMTPGGSGMTARQGALELVLEGGKRGEWEEGEKAVEVTFTESPTGTGALQVLTDRSHIHTLSLSLETLGAPSTLLTPPPHSFASLSPYSLLLTPSQLHFLSPLFNAVVASFALPTNLSSALPLGKGRVAFTGKKADKWGVWVSEVGLGREAGGVSEVMFTKEQTAKVLGPLHPAAETVKAASGAADDKTSTGKVVNSSSAARAKNFEALLAKGDWDALLALVGSPSQSSTLAASAITTLLSTLFALETPPALIKTKGENVLTNEKFLATVCRFGIRDDGEWKSALAGVAFDDCLRVLEIVSGWVAELTDVKKESHWVEVGKGLPSLAEIVPLVTLILDTHLPSLLSTPSSSTLLRDLLATLRPSIRLQRELQDTSTLVEGARRVLRGADRQRARDKKSAIPVGTSAGAKRRAKAQGAKEWQGIYRLEEFVL